MNHWQASLAIPALNEQKIHQKSTYLGALDTTHTK
jgi:hypothetical protein